jgi:hypothetical protein
MVRYLRDHPTASAPNRSGALDNVESGEDFITSRGDWGGLVLLGLLCWTGFLYLLLYRLSPLASMPPCLPVGAQASRSARGVAFPRRVVYGSGVSAFRCSRRAVRAIVCAAARAPGALEVNANLLLAIGGEVAGPRSTDGLAVGDWHRLGTCRAGKRWHKRPGRTTPPVPSGMSGGFTGAGGHTPAAPVVASLGGEARMSTPTDGVTGPLAYAPKWARDAATMEQHNAAREHRVSTGNQEVPFGSALAEARSSDGVWPTELSPAAPSLDPVVLPAPPPRSLLRVRFAIVGGLAISAAAGAITTPFVMEKLPSWGLVAKGDRLAASFEARFIGQNAQTSNLDLFSHASQLAIINIARQRKNQEAQLAEPLRGADHASSTATDGESAPAPANEEPRLAGRMREATADQASSRTTDGAAPSAAASEEPRLPGPMREATAEQACQWAAESPHFWASKIPHFGGGGDQPLG